MNNIQLELANEIDKLDTIASELATIDVLAAELIRDVVQNKPGPIARLGALISEAVRLAGDKALAEQHRGALQEFLNETHRRAGVRAQSIRLAWLQKRAAKLAADLNRESTHQRYASEPPSDAPVRNIYPQETIRAIDKPLTRRGRRAM